MGSCLDYFPHTGTPCYQASGAGMRTEPLATSSCLQSVCQHKRWTPNGFCRIIISLVKTCLLFSFWLISNIDLILGFSNCNYLFARGLIEREKKILFWWGNWDIPDVSQLRSESSFQLSGQYRRKKEGYEAWWKSGKKQLKLHFKHMRINSLIKWTKRSWCVHLRSKSMCTESSRQHLGGQHKNL